MLTVEYDVMWCSMALDGEGGVWVMGRHDYGRLGLGEACTKDAEQPQAIPHLQNATAISAAGSTSLVVTQTGQFLQDELLLTIVGRPGGSHSMTSPRASYIWS